MHDDNLLMFCNITEIVSIEKLKTCLLCNHHIYVHNFILSAIVSIVFVHLI